MKTRVFKMSRDSIDAGLINEAAECIKRGGTVIFPTETVYGLGADGLNPDAVRKIYVAKGRPSDNPLILHISSPDYIDAIANYGGGGKIGKLIERFWPGPLTIVLKKNDKVPDISTGGLDTVAIRMPDDEIALMLISGSGTAIAAPSANISGKPSPTNAEDVIEDMDGKVDIIIDGGPTGIGLESTVVDMSSSVPKLLRPGGITIEELRDTIGDVELDPSTSGNGSPQGKVRSPGMKYRHYSPDAGMLLVEGGLKETAETIKALIKKERDNGGKVVVGVLSCEENRGEYDADYILVPGSRFNPSDYAKNLFSMLRKFDRLGVDVIFAEGIPAEGLGFAVMNRMRRAAGGNIITL